ncbi:MAG: Divalent-cation tolerance protein CutA [Parcubacteria group bacterium GW2011_GWE2_39_37]|uniref:Divalent-cation tolerance protein CutA n=1 Tax=Candidatus Falkowbacteria bacterium GW2011_GWF2_39_8 TaxID=1618642 RepID=A0A0G0T688_9BACT|nr:MAG: Divalent-cation tolerance protein CutA [Parcubacteria group bacterium GW2011_GWE2_39_37]KKR33342.1 MAG: Divalent-cation tolerance protein CutA [Candidatus Falkowbacteria bacterium GW2011_GWF2_39_8]
MKFIILYITYPDLKTAKTISNRLLKQKLVACVNFMPITSSYIWQGKIKNTKEIVALTKTKTENWRRIKKEIEKLHPYDIPCVIKIEAEANKEYVKWIESETK